MMDAVIVVFLLAMGLAVGSFLNVCIYRLPRHESLLYPASRCPSCGRSLRWFAISNSAGCSRTRS